MPTDGEEPGPSDADDRVIVACTACGATYVGRSLEDGLFIVGLGRECTCGNENLREVDM